MTFAEWYQDAYCVQSYGNGLAYVVRDRNTGRELYALQGDEAAEWRLEYDRADRSDKVERFLRECEIAYT